MKTQILPVGSLVTVLPYGQEAVIVGINGTSSYQVRYVAASYVSGPIDPRCGEGRVSVRKVAPR